MEVNLDINFTGYLISWGIAALFLIGSITFWIGYNRGWTFDGSRKNVDDASGICFAFFAIATLVGGIFYWVRDSETFHDGAKVLVRTEFMDGAELYKFSGKYGYVEDSSDCSERADIIVISEVDGTDVTTSTAKYVPYKSLRVVTDKEFYEETGIKAPPE